MKGWLVLVLILAIAVSGWLGWRSASRERHQFDQMTDQWLQQVDLGFRQLTLARDAATGPERLAAMATAHGYLTAAQIQANAFLEDLAPSRRGRPAYMPRTEVPGLLQYAADLTPDLPAPALARRMELVRGLQAALNAGRPGPDKLKASLELYIRSLPADQPFSDDYNRPTITAERSGADLMLRIDWSHRMAYFSPLAPGRLIFVRPGSAAVGVASSAGPQPQLGGERLGPYRVLSGVTDLHDTFKRVLPTDWTAGSYQVIRIPEGLTQELTLRGAASGELLLWKPLSREVAEPVKVGD